MLVTAYTTSLFQEHEDLTSFITSHVPTLEEKSVLVITSKIVALSEGRTILSSDDVTKEMHIKAESELAIKTKYAWLTIKDGILIANGGVDESNANGKLILLPRDSFHTADIVRKQLQKRYNIQDLGVIITDSRTLPLRAGVTGVALGYAGFEGIKDYRGKKDIFGRAFKVSRVDVADSLATAAVYTMGEGNEQRPLTTITDAGVAFCDEIKRDELHISIRDDMYGPLFTNLTHN